MKHTLLIELLTEELPPKSLEALSSDFARRLFDLLVEDRLVARDSPFRCFATPRRLAVLIDDVLDQAADKPVTIPGPPVTAALDREGRPTAALLGFAKKCGVGAEQLRRTQGEKGEVFVCDTVSHGSTLSHVLDLHIADAIRKLPIPKLMRWGSGDTQFVRPVHGLVMMHGTEALNGEVLGLKGGGKTTLGHRFLASEPITIGQAHAYADVLEQKGHVIAEFGKRRDKIAASLGEHAENLKAVWFGHANLSPQEAIRLLDGERTQLSQLLDEVTALVEWPVIYEGHFDKEFLVVPQECLMLSMMQHQKYFPLLDKTTGRLLNRFLIVSNLEARDPNNIIAGNERVLRARLSDAKFFFDQDRKARLETRVPRLAAVVYHNKLGSQLERVQRIQKLASAIAEKLGANTERAERAAWLCKADLLTDMVGEFPELQGTMGQYYARHDGEDEAVARAIEAHYHPRFAADTLPEDNIGCAVALADKLDTLVGIYGIGLVPTGDKDPFGLRRQALGVLRILSERALPLDLLELLQLAKLAFPSGMLADSVTVDLHGFMLERLRNYLRERGFAQDEVEAVVGQNPTRVDQVIPRLTAVQAFRALPEAQSLASANKRIRNILRKTTVAQTEPDPALLTEKAEKNLYAATSRLLPSVRSLVSSRDYAEALRVLAGVRKEVDTFFDEVMVMADEPIVRNNRLALLALLESLLNQVADISKLATQSSAG